MTRASLGSIFRYGVSSQWSIQKRHTKHDRTFFQEMVLVEYIDLIFLGDLDIKNLTHDIYFFSSIKSFSIFLQQWDVILCEFYNITRYTKIYSTAPQCSGGPLYGCLRQFTVSPLNSIFTLTPVVYRQSDFTYIKVNLIGDLDLESFDICVDTCLTYNLVLFDMGTDYIESLNL